jgi:hypothetical protein
MTPLSFRAADGLELDVQLRDETVPPLLDALRIASPLLVTKIEDALRNPPAHVVELEEEEVEFLSAAANTVRRSHRIADSELDRIALLL